jgi:hypothetical protein
MQLARANAGRVSKALVAYRVKVCVKQLGTHLLQSHLGEHMHHGVAIRVRQQLEHALRVLP